MTLMKTVVLVLSFHKITFNSCNYKLFMYIFCTLDLCSRQSHLFISIFTQVFPGIFHHIFLPTAVLIVPGAVKVVVIS